MEDNEKIHIPDNMIQTLKSLYESAKTQVIVNGVISSSFEVSRGVRQGGLWLCLLFNIGIEPPSNTLRNSPKLTHFKIPGMTENIKSTLFTDDIPMYLNEHNSYEDLEEELNT